MTSALDPLNGLFSVDNFPFGDNTWTVAQLVVGRGKGRAGMRTLTTNLKQLCKKFWHIEKFAQPQNTLENVWGV